MIKIKMPDAVLEIFFAIKEYGADAYVVGGCVRDSIIGREPHDWDICTPVLAPELQVMFEEKGYKVITTGLQHGTITVVVDGEAYEITQFRRDGSYSDGRHPDNVEFTGNLIEDLERRDFTINAMAYNPDSGVIDPFNGMQDIKDRKIRCVGSAKDRFKEDSLRILRAIRFAAQLDFSITPDTYWGIIRGYGRLERISIERINSEFCKIVSSNHFCPQMTIYKKVFALFIPEIRDMFRFQQNNPYHPHDVYYHTIHAIKACDESGVDDLIVKLAVFFHDIGKPHCYQDDTDGIRHFKGHGRVSADITDSIMRRLRFDNDTREKVVELIYYHDATFEAGTKYVKRWLSKIGEKQFRRLLDLRKADIKAQNPKYEKDRIQKINDINMLLDEIISEESCFAMKDLAVNGSDLISIGYKQGKELGSVLNTLLQMVIDEEVINDKEILLFKDGNLLIEKRM